MSGTEKKESTALTRAVMLIALYFLSGLLGRKIAFLNETIALVWPPSGIALAAVLLFGNRFWPLLGIALGAVLFSLLDGKPSVFFTLGTALGNTVGAVTCAYLLNRFVKFDNNMVRTRDGAGFILLACGLGTTVNAMFNVFSLVYDKKVAEDAIFPTVMEWWVPNALAALVVTPVIITWASSSFVKLSFWRTCEGTLCAVGLVCGSLMAFNTWFVYGLNNYQLAYLPYPFLAWSALRFGPRGATTGTLMVAGFAIFSLLEKRGPFYSGDELVSLRLIGCYIGMLAVSNLLLASATTERRRAMVSVVTNERRLRTVMADQTDMICRFTTDGAITYANPAYCAFHGKSEEELLGVNFYKLLAKGSANSELPPPLSADRAQMTFDRRFETSDGRVEWQQCNIRRLDSGGQAPEEFQAVIQDVTARKRAELAARDAKATLEQMNQQLQLAVSEARTLAEQANRANSAKSEFLANMSHEIRTPLSGILGMLELLTQTRMDTRQREFAEAAVDSANALLHVINDVLDFSKIEAGKMTVSQEEFMLRSVVESVLENAVTRTAGKKVTLAAIVARNVPRRLTGDPARLRQVLLNLVGNGVKFTDHGEVVVRVNVLMQSQGKSTLRVEVADTGIGMSPDDLKRLFQPFVQADTSSSRKFGGTGLGLAISRKMVDLMGGRIGVDSVLGTGSTFWFELPFGVPPQSPIDRFFPGLVFLQAIVAVPNESQRQALVEQLNGWGVVCKTVENFKELTRALPDHLRASVIPLLICDDEMIAVGGDRLKRLLAESKDRMHCILLASPAGSLGADAAGPDAIANVLLKPVRELPLFEALVSVVSDVKPEADRSEPQRNAQPQSEPTEPAAAKRTPISGLSILVAEDHPFNRKLCQLMLQNFGARAEWATNGLEAVEKFSPGRFDAILMDCNMPEMDGFDATAAIRKVEVETQEPHRVRIIALTANALAGERERCLAAGMDDYIAKPFTAQQLYQALLESVPHVSTSEVSDTNMFNPAKLEQLCNELDRAAVVDMVGDFLKEFPDRLTEIGHLYEAAKWPQLERAAHSLKGLIALFGFQQLSERFLAIEDSAEEGNAAKVRESLAGLDVSVNAAAQRLQEWLQEARSRAGD